MSDVLPTDAPSRPDAAVRRAAAPAGRDGDAFGFWDLLDIVNPLQHIPVVSTLYRQLTGDEIRPPARILGATLFGGPVGLILSVADAVVAESTGRTVAEHALALLDAAEPAAGATPAAMAAAAAPPEARAAVLPNGFPLTPRSRTGVPVLAPPVGQAAILRAAPGEALAIAADTDRALARLAAQSGAASGSAAPGQPPTVADAQVPEAMMRALELYRQTFTAPAAPGAAGLDTRS